MRKTRKLAVTTLLSSLLLVVGLVAASCATSDDTATIDTQARDDAAAAKATADAAAKEASAALKGIDAVQNAIDEVQELVASGQQDSGQQDEMNAVFKRLEEASKALDLAKQDADDARKQLAEARKELEAARAQQGAEAAQGIPIELVIAITTEPDTLDGQVVNDRAARVMTGNLYEALLFRDREAKLSPGLATSWRNVDESTWEFTLREGVMFHDGSPFNAESAAYSVNRMIADDFETQRGSYIRNIAGAEIVDDYTINVSTDGPNAILLLQMAQVPMVPNGAGDEINDNPVGTGPYRFVEWARGQSITAERNPDYWGEGGSIQRFSVRVIPDAQTALAALQSGEVHLVLDILPEQIRLVPQYKSVPATEYSYIAFNTYKEELADSRVRVAMNLAIDKEKLASTIYEGFGRPNQAQHLSPGSLGFNPNIEPFPYDPELAKELLAAAGYPEGFSVTLNIPIGRYLRGEETGRLVEQQLRDIGLDVNLRLWEWNEYRSAGRIKGTEENAFDLKYGWNSNEWFDGARTASHLTCGGSSSKFCDDFVDEQFEIGATNLDQDTRNEAYQKAWKRLHENPHAIYLLQQDLIYGMAANFVWEPRLDDEYYVREMSFTG